MCVARGIGSKHTAQSSCPLAVSTHFSCSRFRMAGRLIEPTLAVPEPFSDDGRAAFLQIARRAQVDHVNAYTVLSLGLQAHLSASEIKAASVRF